MKEKIIDFIRKKGPIVPTELASEIGTDSIIASAYLSDLLSKKTICISNVKVGSSPLYYLPDQKPMLEKFSDKLHEKERIAFNELKNRKVLRDEALSPLMRVALRNVKDFAIPLEVTYHNRKEIFWKFYSMKNEDVHEEIRKILAPLEKKEEIIHQQKPEEKKQEEKLIEKIEKKPEKKLFDKPKTKEKEPEEEKPKKEEKKEVKEEKKELKKEEKIEKKPEKKEIKEEKQEPKKEKKEQEEEKEEQTTVFEEQKFFSRKIESSDPFMKRINEFFSQTSVFITNHEILKKNSEIDLEIKFPSSLGDLTYYCKAKRKQKITDADISSAYVGGEMRKLPVVLLITGVLTKQAKEMLSRNFKGIKLIRMP